MAVLVVIFYLVVAYFDNYHLLFYLHQCVREAITICKKFAALQFRSTLQATQIAIEAMIAMQLCSL